MNETTQTTESKEAFIIDTREKADWLLRKLANLEADKARMDTQYQTMLRQNESEKNSLLEHFGPQLENFTRAELEAAKGKRKSLTLFHGTVGFRSVASRLVIESESDALTTARAVAPQTITQETVERFDRKSFTAHAQSVLEATGELLPGMKKTESREDFSIKFPSSKEKAEETP